MKANLKSNLSWLLLMVVGFVLINFLVVIGVIDSFTENMLVTIGINIILAVGLNLVIGFQVNFRSDTLDSWQSAHMRQES